MGMSLINKPSVFISWLNYVLISVLNFFKNGLIHKNPLVYYRWITFGAIMYFGKTSLNALYHFTDHDNFVLIKLQWVLLYSFLFGWDFFVTRSFLIEQGYTLPKKTPINFALYILKFTIIISLVSVLFSKNLELQNSFIDFIVAKTVSYDLNISKNVLFTISTLFRIFNNLITTTLLFWQFVMIDRNYGFKKLWKPIWVSGKIARKSLILLMIASDLQFQLMAFVKPEGAMGILFPIIVTLVFKQCCIGVYKTYRKQNLASYNLY
jgi:hypothetical protein